MCPTVGRPPPVRLRMRQRPLGRYGAYCVLSFRRVGVRCLWWLWLSAARGVVVGVGEGCVVVRLMRFVYGVLMAWQEPDAVWVLRFRHMAV